MVITISKQAAVEKPTANDIRFIWSREDAYEKRELSVREFAEMCGKGHTWRAALYKGESEYFRKSDADCITAIALDIDKLLIDILIVPTQKRAFFRRPDCPSHSKLKRVTTQPVPTI